MKANSRKSLVSSEELSIQRAIRSMSCLPFKRKFYETLCLRAMDANDVCNSRDYAKYAFLPFGIDRAEEHFRWMIRLGILRREVDGQGLTSKIRLTPIGRKALSNINGEIRRASLRDRIIENFRRHSARLD